ncbi:MAG TPA: hypothetical protein P5016_00245 [Verrucomicrobiales bacterium]|nr:hypothetical protein [Verrucomicrobiae bacterium]MCP5554303.1 hypothetical protein [Akkermansiaceae bacterium]HRX52900.1 hypothetical protein [Verrucomicrobiales bacterium]
MNPPETPADLRDLESKLSQLRPAPLSGSLLRHLSESLSESHSTVESPVFRLVAPESDASGDTDRIIWLRFLPVAAAACAAIAVLLLSRATPEAPARVVQNAPISAESPAATPSPAPPAAAPWTGSGFQPVSMQQHVQSANDHGILELRDKGPVREIHLQIEETQQWADPETSTQIRIIQPRQEILYVPVTPR